MLECYILLEKVGIGWNMLELALKGWNRLGMAVNGCKFLELL